jgi:hypothetical protein
MISPQWTTGISLAVFTTASSIMLPLQADDREAQVTDKSYLEECGACHFAYQPEFLPARSWQKMMGGLEDHFGENAELDTELQTALTQFLTANASDQVKTKTTKKFRRGISESTPLRITEIPYFKHEHEEIPAKMVTQNPEVKSLSYCNKCHTKAETGNYDEESISIPGFGRWDD